jgi:hypothetical protein
MGSTITPKTLGLALVAFGLALTHAAIGEPTTSTGSKVSTFRPGAGSGGSTINTFNKSGGTASKGVATVKGEPDKYKRVVLASNAGSRSSKGSVRGKVTHEPPVIRVRRVEAGAGIETLVPGVTASAHEAPVLFASAEMVESPLVAIAQPEVEVRSDMLPRATAQQESEVILADVSPIKIPPLPVSGAPVPDSVREDEASKPATPMVTGGSLNARSRRR